MTARHGREFHSANVEANPNRATGRSGPTGLRFRDRRPWRGRCDRAIMSSFAGGRRVWPSATPTRGSDGEAVRTRGRTHFIALDEWRASRSTR